MNGLRRPWLFAALLLALALALPASAHPLGQNAWNREAAIIVAPERIRIDYLLDLAEISTLAAGVAADRDSDGRISAAEWTAHTEHWARTLPAMLDLRLAGQPLALAVDSQQWALVPGESGLDQLRLLARLSAAASPGDQPVALVYVDGSPERLGWREVSISAEAGIRIVNTDVPAVSRTDSLSNFTARPEGPPTLVAAHADIVRAPAAAGRPVQLALAARAGSSAAGPSLQPPTVAAFFKLGVHHIAIGWDHLMFLLGLVLLSGRLRQLAITITAFTVAHSITLALASQGLVTPPAAGVEALIAATIAYVGLLALRTRLASHGPWLAFGFGLVHGFGFAGALADSLGADRSLNLVGLLGFNLGIECFQLLLVAAVVPLLSRLGRETWYPQLHQALAGSVVLAGSYWLIERTLADQTLAIAGALLITVASLIGYGRRLATASQA